MAGEGAKVGGGLIVFEWTIRPINEKNEFIVKKWCLCKNLLTFDLLTMVTHVSVGVDIFDRMIFYHSVQM